VLELLAPRIGRCKVRFLVATGCHRAPTREEYDFVFGDLYDPWKDRIFAHDAKKESDLVKIGTSRNGTEMIVNRMAAEAGKLVIIGSVEPHYFAGYTGGRKSFLPGVASYRTIEQNHKYALRPEAKGLALDGNPVHDDMMDALKSIEEKPIFSIQTVLDPEKRIYAATAGNIRTSFDAAIARADEVFVVPVSRRADIVVSVAPYPMDVDLYQSQKAIDNAKLALKAGGILILVSRCRTGIGEESFYRLLSSCRTPQDAMAAIDKGYKLGYHKAAKLAEIAMAAQMWCVSDLPDEQVRNVFMTPFPTVQAAVDAALEKKGKDATVTVLLEGSVTVPRLEA
jgi:nickel-dependent lactate racemase